MRKSIVIVGGGFCGLAAALELSKKHDVTVIEKDKSLGGLAGSFQVGNHNLEKFYHHWFTSDEYIIDLIESLGLKNKIILKPTNTSVFYSNSHYRLSSPKDLLRFSPISLLERIKLGLFTLYVRRINNWRKLESKTAFEWLRGMLGDRVFGVVWEPLLRGKFGKHAEDISAVWFWNKIKLRGGSRKKSGEECLAYLEGGFGVLVDEMARQIELNGGMILTSEEVCALKSVENSNIVITSERKINADVCLFTVALPIVKNILGPLIDYQKNNYFRDVRYIGNICLVLELKGSLSDTYWINVNDPDYPFVGVIEHTNFIDKKYYDGKSLVYLSKYLDTDDALYLMEDKKLLSFSSQYLKSMFPQFDEDWIVNYHVWREPYSQPLIDRYYSKKVPPHRLPVKGVYLSTMAQIYPEDRGTNYAVREGIRIAKLISDDLDDFVDGKEH